MRNKILSLGDATEAVSFPDHSLNFWVSCMSVTQPELPPNVLLVSSDKAVVKQVRDTLADDYQLHAVEDSMVTLPGFLKKGRPDLILVIRESVDEPYLEILSQLLVESPLPVLVFVFRDPHRTARAAIRLGITSFVVDAFEEARIPTLIDVTLERFKQSQSLREELTKSQEELAARKVIERAKGLLMDRKKMSEEDAYRALRQLAMRQSKPIKEVSETLLMYSDILP